MTTRKVDIRLPGRDNSKYHGARPVHQIISMITCIRSTGLSIKKSLSAKMTVRLITKVLPSQMLNPTPNDDLERRLAILHMAFALERAGPVQPSLSMHQSAEEQLVGQVVCRNVRCRSRPQAELGFRGGELHCAWHAPTLRLKFEASGLLRRTPCPRPAPW